MGESVFIQLTIETLRLCNSCIVYDRKTKDAQGQDLPTQILASLFASLIFAGLPYHLTIFLRADTIRVNFLKKKTVAFTVRRANYAVKILTVSH